MELPGLPGRWVRASVALPMMGIQYRNRVIWERPRGMRETFLVPLRHPCPSHPYGAAVYYALPNAMAMAAYRSDEMRRRWTLDEDAVVRQTAWRETWETIGRRLNRPAGSCSRRATQLGLKPHDLTLRRDGLLSLRDLANLVGATEWCVCNWVKYKRDPLPTSKVSPQHRRHRVDLHAFRAWVINHPGIVSRMPAAKADLLGLDVVDGKVVDLKQQESAA